MTKYGEFYMCIDGLFYGPCSHEFCGGVCQPLGDCPDDYEDEDDDLLEFAESEEDYDDSCGPGCYCGDYDD